MKKLVEQVKAIAKKFSDLPASKEYLSRAKESSLTRDENIFSHFCVYFAAFDPDNKEIFFGHHKKSGLWLFNGGHIDKGEVFEETLVREMGEEWGVQINLQNIGEPKLITVTSIKNPINNPKMKCVKHYDVWYFVPVSKTTFSPDKEKLDTEFFIADWKTINEARSLVSDPSTLVALTEFEKIFNNIPRLKVKKGGKMKIGIVGSMQHTEKMMVIKDDLIRMGHQAFMTNLAKPFIGKTDKEKEKIKIFQKQNKDAIREFWELMQGADAILVANFDKNGIKNYIGGNTLMEIGFAHVLGQKIFLLNPIPDIIYYKTEVEAVKPIILNGNLSQIK